MKKSTLRSLLDASGILFFNSFWSRSELKLRLIFWFNGVSNYHIINGQMRDLSLVAAHEAQCADPEQLGVLMWPLVDARWIAKKRLRMLFLHYQETELIGLALRLNLHESRTIVFYGADLSQLSIRIEREEYFRREGQMALSIFHGEDRIYSVVFLLSRSNGKRTAYIGAIQGVKQSEDSLLYKSITKNAHGLRPRDFVISVFLVFCKAINVCNVYAIQDRHRHHRHPYFSNTGTDKVIANYDLIWDEHEGILNSDGFFELQPGIRMKDSESIPSKKRSMYRKRYALLADTQTAFVNALATNTPTIVSSVAG